MPQIVCKIKDSANTPLVGFIRVLADYTIVGATSDGSTIVPAFKDTQLVNGYCLLDLAPSALAQVTYSFQIYQTVGSEHAIVWQFRAKVPESLVPIDLYALEPTGLTHDAQDASVLTVTRKILADDNFWAQLKGNILNFKGAFNLDRYYQKGDAVVWQGSSYIYIREDVLKGYYPNNDAVWLLIAARGETSAAVAGDPTSFSTDWRLDNIAPSKSAIYQLWESLAPKRYAQLDTPQTTNLLAPEDHSQSIPYTGWVQERLNFTRAASIQDAATRIETARLNAIGIALTYTDNTVISVVNTKIPKLIDGGTYIAGRTRSMVASTWVDYFKQVITVPTGGCKTLFINAMTTGYLTTAQPMSIFLRINIPGVNESDRSVYGIDTTLSTRTQHITFSNLNAGTYNVQLGLQLTGTGTYTDESTKMTTQMFF